MNNIIVVGNLGQDAEEKTYANGEKKFWVFSVATNETWFDKSSGEKKKVTTWHKCQLFGNYEKLVPYLRQGSTVCVHGLQRNDVIDMRRGGEVLEFDGKPIRMTIPYIKVNSIELCGSRRDNDTPATQPAKTQAATKAQVTSKVSAPEEDDSLPF